MLPLSDFNTPWPLSAELTRRALDITASDRADLEATLPFVTVRGKGPYVWDLEGHQFLDFTNATGTNPLGYSHDEVDAAVIEQIRERGTLLPSMLSEIQVEVAERIVQIF